MDIARGASSSTCELGRILWVGSRVFPHARSLVAGLRAGSSRSIDRRLLARSWFIDVPESENGASTMRRCRDNRRSDAPRRRFAHRTSVLEQAIRCPGVMAVVADGEGLPMACTRRLHLAVRQAEAQGRRILVLLLRPPWDLGTISAAASRWGVAPMGHETAVRPRCETHCDITPHGDSGRDPVRGESLVSVAWRLQMLHCKGGVGVRASGNSTPSERPGVIDLRLGGVPERLWMHEWECRDGCDTANSGDGASGVVGGTGAAKVASRTIRGSRPHRSDPADPVDLPRRTCREPVSEPESPVSRDVAERGGCAAVGSAVRLPSLDDTDAWTGDRPTSRDGDEPTRVAVGHSTPIEHGSPKFGGRATAGRAGTRRADRGGSADRQAMLFEMPAARGPDGPGPRRGPHAAR